MDRYREIVLFLVALFALTLFGAMAQEKRKPYKAYQKTYQVRKLEALGEKLAADLPLEERASIEAEMASLKRDLPAVQELLLKDGRKERCLTCHIGIEPISDSHPVETFGCTLCHGGDPLSVTLPAAHQGLIGGRNPSGFDVVDQGCGQTMPDGTACHNGDPGEERDHIQRVRTTIMATKAGEIANPRFTFGAQKSLEAIYGVAAIQGRDPDGKENIVPELLLLPYAKAADLPTDPEGQVIRTDLTGEIFSFSGKKVDTQLHQNCASQCHIRAEAVAEPYLNRASGCASCHYLYDERSTYRGDDPTIKRDEAGHGPYHRLTLKIPYSQCNHCHNRGVHSLLGMKFDSRTDLEDVSALEGDGLRIQDYYNPMTLFTLCEYKLDCADCHTDREVMGDGYLYSDKIAQQRIRCYTCHGTLTAPPVIRRLTGTELPKIQRIMRTYSRNPGEEALFTVEGEILPHVNIVGGQLVLTGKATEKKFDIPQIYGSACQQDREIQDANSCHACHGLHLKGEAEDGGH